MLQYLCLSRFTPKESTDNELLKLYTDVSWELATGLYFCFKCQEKTNK